MTPDGWYFARLDTLSRVNPEQLGNRTDPDYVLEYLDIAAIDRPGVIGASRLLTFEEAPSRVVVQETGTYRRYSCLDRQALPL